MKINLVFALCVFSLKAIADPISDFSPNEKPKCRVKLFMTEKSVKQLCGKPKMRTVAPRSENRTVEYVYEFDGQIYLVHFQNDAVSAIY